MEERPGSVDIGRSSITTSSAHSFGLAGSVEGFWWIGHVIDRWQPPQCLHNGGFVHSLALCAWISPHLKHLNLGASYYLAYRASWLTKKPPFATIFSRRSLSEESDPSSFDQGTIPQASLEPDCTLQVLLDLFTGQPMDMDVAVG